MDDSKFAKNRGGRQPTEISATTSIKLGDSPTRRLRGVGTEVRQIKLFQSSQVMIAANADGFRRTHKLNTLARVRAVTGDVPEADYGLNAGLPLDIMHNCQEGSGVSVDIGEKGIAHS